MLPLDNFDLGGEDPAAFIRPYQIAARAGEAFSVTVEVRNPFGQDVEAAIRLEVPRVWTTDPSEQRIALDVHGQAEVVFKVIPAGPPVRRARIAADLTFGDRRLGQVAEALVTITT